jgi:hypothetical protein
MQALATLPSLRNATDVTNHLFDVLRTKICAMGYLYLSALIEAHIVECGPSWMRQAKVLKTIDNYLRTGIRFSYFQVDLSTPPIS